MLENEATTMNEVVAYIRCSTDEQAKAGFSVEAQKEELQRVAALESIIIKKFYIDDGYSASDLNRPDIQNLLSDIKLGKVHKIMIRHSDRLVRNLVLKRALERIFDIYKVELISLNHDVSHDSPERALFSDMIALFNEGELKKISPRTIKGYRGSAINGNYPIGKIPFGYKREKNTKLGKGSYLVLDPENSKIVSKIFNTLAANQTTVADLAKWMRAHKVADKKWSRKMILQIVDDPLYYGRFLTDWFDSDDPTISDIQKANWYNLEYHTEPIVSKELWEQTQKAVHHYKKKSNHKYYFDRLVYDEDEQCWMGNESAWKTTRKGEKILYKYYSNRKMKYRISEKRILRKFIEVFENNRLSEIDKNEISKLKDQINRITDRISILAYDYDTGYISREDYINDKHKAHQEIHRLESLIVDLQSKQKIPFDKYSEDKKCALVSTNIKKVLYSRKNDSINFVFKDL